MREVDDIRTSRPINPRSLRNLMSELEVERSCQVAVETTP